MADPVDLRDLALAAARRVAPELRRQAGSTPSDTTKSSATDLVTAADRWSEERIVHTLLDARPADGVLGEEGATVEGSSGVRWVIDPIDGTTNFVYGLPGYTVSIGAELDGELVAGVILDPYSGEEFAAARGVGATRDGRPIRVNRSPGLETALVATGFGYQPGRRAAQAQVLVDVLPRVRDIRRSGGAAHDLTCVACGRVDAYFERGLNPWDIAAGTVIVTEAGGRVTDLDGHPATGEFVVAAVADLHGPLLDLLHGAAADQV